MDDKQHDLAYVAISGLVSVSGLFTAIMLQRRPFTWLTVVLCLVTICSFVVTFTLLDAYHEKYKDDK